MSQKIGDLPTVDPVSTAALRKAFTGYVGEDGEQLISEDWPIASITYTSDGSVDTITYTGPTGSWTMTPHYSSAVVDYITIAGPGATGSWRQTLTYSGSEVVAMSAWIKQ